MGKKREKKGRMDCCEKGGVRRGAWSGEEDELLVNFITQNGHGTWRNLPKNAGLLRCGKSCRLRWTNYLRPDIKRGPFSPDEEATIIRLQSTLGNKWAAIASHLPGRTDNDIKNFWNSHLRKRFTSKPDYSTSESPDIKPLLLHPPSGDDHFLRLWNSQVGESFRHINDTTSESEPAEQKLEYKEEEQQVGAYSDQMDHQSGSMLNLLLDFPANLEFLQDPCDGLSTG